MPTKKQEEMKIVLEDGKEVSFSDAFEIFWKIKNHSPCYKSSGISKR